VNIGFLMLVLVYKPSATFSFSSRQIDPSDFNGESIERVELFIAMDYAIKFIEDRDIENEILAS
jgi:hypothetical protein